MANQGGRGGVAAAQIPTSFGHELRSCLRCRLIKTLNQFQESGCENCPFFQMEDDYERVKECTTPISLGKCVPGCYTLAVSEELPQDLQNICEEEHVPYVPPKRI